MYDVERRPIRFESAPELKAGATRKNGGAGFAKMDAIGALETPNGRFPEANSANSVRENVNRASQRARGYGGPVRHSAELAPGVAFAKGGDVCDMVAAVPGVERERLIERHSLILRRMQEFALPI